MPSQRPSTARARLVAAVTEEILKRNEQASFPISSEHQLCQRFKVSRVTIRLALSDLENRGLIFRKHGKGTFAHGGAKKPPQSIAVLRRMPDMIERWPVAEMVRGMQMYLTAHNSAVVLLGISPLQWSAELSKSFSGVLVFPEGFSREEIEVLQNRKLPFLSTSPFLVGDSQVCLGQTEAARKMTEELLQLGHRRFALLAGYDPSLDAAKRIGIHEALQAASGHSIQVKEFTVPVQGDSGQKIALAMLQTHPRPTAVIAFDDSLGLMVSVLARREGLHLPGDLSIVGFHHSPYLRYLEPKLATVQFDFFEAGRRAAEVLTLAARTGEKAPSLFFKPTYCAMQSTGAPRSFEEQMD